MHQENHRVLSAQCRFELAFGVGRIRRIRNYQPRHMGKPRLDTVVVLSTAKGDSARGPDDERDGCTPHVPRLRGLIYDLIHRSEDEVDEVEVDHGPHAVKGRAHACGDHSSLRDGSVSDSIHAKFWSETLHLSEMAASLVQVGTDDKDGVISLHLFAHSLLKRLR